MVTSRVNCPSRVSHAEATVPYIVFRLARTCVRLPPGCGRMRTCLYPGRSGSISIPATVVRSEEHTSELQSRPHLVCRLLLEKKKNKTHTPLPSTQQILCLI